MGEAADPAPANKGRVAPPMAWRTRLAVLAAGYVTDATRRADGTVNRRLLGVLDKGVPASEAPRNGVASRDVVIDPAVPLRARLFHPAPGAEDGRPLPVVVFFHGGGFAYLSASSPAYDAACRRIARYAGAAVLSVDYRRSPEHRYPAAYDDGFTALRFLDDPTNHQGTLPPLDASRCFLAGDSAGGNIAHHVARRYSLDPSAFANVRLRGLIAIQPFFGGEERTPAELRLDGAPIVNVPRTDWMWRAFLPPGADRTHEACSPACAVSGIGSAPAFPPATVVVGGYDPLQDWQRRYCDALRGEGKEARVLEYPDAIHAFYVFPEFPEAKDLMLRIKEIVAAGSEDVFEELHRLVMSSKKIFCMFQCTVCDASRRSHAGQGQRANLHGRAASCQGRRRRSHGRTHAATALSTRKDPGSVRLRHQEVHRRNRSAAASKEAAQCRSPTEAKSTAGAGNDSKETETMAEDVEDAPAAADVGLEGITDIPATEVEAAVAAQEAGPEPTVPRVEDPSALDVEAPMAAQGQALEASPPGAEGTPGTAAETAVAAPRPAPGSSPALKMRTFQVKKTTKKAANPVAAAGDGQGVAAELMEDILLAPATIAPTEPEDAATGVAIAGPPLTEQAFVPRMEDVVKETPQVEDPKEVVVVEKTLPQCSADASEALDDFEELKMLQIRLHNSSHVLEKLQKNLVTALAAHIQELEEDLEQQGELYARAEAEYKERLKGAHNQLEALGAEQGSLFDQNKRLLASLKAINRINPVASMAETPTTPPGKPKPPMSRLMRLSLKVVDRVTDATRRADGTLNRCALSLLDPRVPAISSPCRGVASRDVVLDRALRLRARLFHPAAAAAATVKKAKARASAAGLPVIVFFHGGGFAYLSAASPVYDSACRRIARYASAAVLSVDYRRAPEHRFPAPYDDGLAALRFLDDPKNHPVPLDVSRCYVAGDSAGGNIAHHVARRYAADAASFRTVRLAGLIAIQPFFGGEERTPAELRLDGAAPIVSIDRTDWMWRAFLPPGADRTHEAANFASPAAAAGLDSPAFPPVLLAIGGFDPLQDWQRLYAEMLKGMGKDVRVAEYPDAIHAFYVFPGFDDARDFIIRIAEFVAESAGGGSSE
ncbi:putative carboxylesterase 18 [Dichanthelium oligosanthes]|uniref:Putative carboxylesterase 18 n=1 Tax=Dichanthelium oligosanthes TaxID=888268 RepID=A0A1E5VJ98_9POAL|nr:putative carboxylesterase 18 [Dichanthelium oligosanthes]